MKTIVLSGVTSFIVCSLYYSFFKIGLNKWLEKFFEQETENIKNYLSKDK